MPELPEVETVRRGLAPAMEGARIDRLELRRADLRFPFPHNLAEALKGKTIVGLGRRAKYLLIDFAEPSFSIVCHLGMSGSFRIESGSGSDTPGEFHYDRSKDPKHDHVVLHLSRPDGTRLRVVYNDPRRFGFMLRADEPMAQAMIAGLGVEPTSNEFSPAILSAMLAGKTAPLKAALLDQRLVAGLGNIYASEALWRAQLSPMRQAKSIVANSGRPGIRVERLATAIREVIADAIAAGGSSLRDHRQADGTLGYFQHSFAVYDRAGKPCMRLGCCGTIGSMVQSGRSTYYCLRCQH